ncbi:MAG: hypothetical protein RR921_06910 [Mucinivorans sp.]
MKRILFILLSIFLLQTTVYGCVVNDAAQNPINAVANDSRSKLSDEERTENNFYNFIRYDVIGVIGENNPAPKNILHYTEFSSANQAYGYIINWIVPARERRKFDRTKQYDSDMMRVGYTEDVKEGFAKLTVTFKNRKEITQCVVVFNSIQ